MIIKCKMCGGDIEFTPGETYGTCEYCGSTSTIPKAEDESKLNRYNRANHFRRQCEFDKALTAYEKILEQDDTDAEAHWGAALSRYGIEYVEDPATKKRIPTCHRLQVASIRADADYLAAVENAPDAESRRLYEEQAAQIAEIQKGILAISANEKPYDVFICYKESDDGGSRTRDSQWAQDVYYGLTDAGYKVFFSRITLEDKLGQQYEPYIFAALNSAKVMVVIGSKPEYFNAVWVKNEWSRYLALMAQDRKRLLIPCYRDMDPYDLPEELSALQSQDMSKIGFMQDLLRGVKKVLGSEQKSEEVKQPARSAAPAASAAVPGVLSLIERAYLFMEDGDFQNAGAYLNRVLDIDPKYAPAYAAKACVSFKFTKEEDLGEAAFLYDDNADWQKALRFADAAQKEKYQEYFSRVKARVKARIRNYAYDCAVALAVSETAGDAFNQELDEELKRFDALCSSSEGNSININRRQNSAQNEAAFKRAVTVNEPGEVSEKTYKLAATRFFLIGDDEAKKCAEQCNILAEQARQKQIYTVAIAQKEETDSAASLEKIAAVFRSIPKYRDAEEQAKDCIRQANTIRENLYQTAVDAMKQAGDTAQWQKVKEIFNNSDLDNYRDVAQLRLQAAKRYDEYAAEQEEIRRQKQALLQRQAAAKAAKRKQITMIAFSAVIVAVAVILFMTKVIIPSYQYKQAVALRTNGEYEQAVSMFKALESYSDSKTQVFVTYYAEGEAKRDAGNYDEAVTAFTNAGSYGDAEAQITETLYQKALSLHASGDYAAAYSIFTAIKGYKDVDTLLSTDEKLQAAAAKAALEAKWSVGNYVEFGTYPQTEAGNDNTAIAWLVIDRDGEKALLISRYGLDAQPYNTSMSTGNAWEKCTLRTWLNDTFLNKAFTSEEQKCIVLTNVDNSESQGYSSWSPNGWSTNGGNNTLDKIFLLSYAEKNKYFGDTYIGSDNTKALVEPTAYAIAQGADTNSKYKTADGKAASFWWLRSPAGYQGDAMGVSGDGYVRSNNVSNDACVRAVLWVELSDSLIFY